MVGGGIRYMPAIPARSHPYLTRFRFQASLTSDPAITNTVVTRMGPANIANTVSIPPLQRGNFPERAAVRFVSGSL
jgi:hypothetical protein